MINWDEIGQEAAQLLSAYLKIPSINPPGDERETARFLKNQLENRGIKAQTFYPEPNRANLTARLSGNKQKKPILLYNHMDVVEANQAEWSISPFSGMVCEEFVYGRGAIDMKGMAIMQLLAMDLLKQRMPERSRDIIFFSAADEEKGGKLGTQWMIENHWDKISCEYVWDEGGFGLVDVFGPAPIFTIAVAEKKDLWINLTAHGKPGHSGMPHDDNAIVILLNAVNKILAINTNYRFHPVVRKMFREISKTHNFPKSFLLRNINHPTMFRILRPILTRNQTVDAMLKDTVSVTIFNAGKKENVIPDLATATLDFRLLPDQDPQDFMDRLKKSIADERIEIQVIHHPTGGAVSDIQSPFYQILSEVLTSTVSGSIAAPMLTPGTTDSCFFRNKGINSFGIFPIVINGNELARFHGHDERISIDNLKLGTQIFYTVLKKMCAISTG